MRLHRRGRSHRKWNMDITYLKVKGYDMYLYRAIDKDGNLVDVYLSDTRDKKAAEEFFKACEATTGIHRPTQITTDKEPAFPSAIKKAFGDDVTHRDSKYMNNVMEQSHRGIKSRYQTDERIFKTVGVPLIFCTVFEEIKQFFRMKNKTQSQRRHGFAPRFQEFEKMAV